MSELSKRIKCRREELRMSQDELAKKLGYRSRSSINKIEKGENDVPQSKIMALAIALSTTPEHLMGWDSPKTVQPDFSDDEKNLIEVYRSLNDSKRQALTCFLAFLKSQQSTAIGGIIQNNSGDNNFLAVGDGSQFINTH